MTQIQLFHSTISGNVPPNGLLVGEIAFNVADNFQFIGYGGDINYDVYGNPLTDLPPPGKGWKTFVTGGGDQPGPPGPGVPPGGTTGQILAKLTDGDYVTGWVPTYGLADPDTLGVVYGYTAPPLGGNASVSLGYQAQINIGAGLRNVALGYQAGLNQNDVNDNVVIGYSSAWNIDGNQNVIIGSEAFGNDPGGNAVGNVGIGYQAGYNVTSGDYNVFLGYQAGDGVRSGSNNVIIGNYPGGANWSGNVALADGSGDLKFLANQAGAWSADGVDFGEEDFVLTSQGSNLPPVWKPVPLGFVSRIVAGQNITISPTDGTGVVTINASGGGGGGGITSLQANVGLKVSGGGANPIVSSGGLEVDFTKVVATSLYNANGTLLIGTTSGPVGLPVGTPGQLLQVSQAGAVGWASIPSASPATPTTLGLVYGTTDNSNTYYGYGSGSGLTGTNNVIIGETAGSSLGSGSNNTIIGAYQGTSGMTNSVALATGAGSVRFFSNSSGAWSASGDSQFGQAGQVLTSQGSGAAPVWTTPVNAPITDVTDGAGILTSIDGTTLNIENTGVIAINANAPIQATNTDGYVLITAPTVVTNLTPGTNGGITITGTGNSRTITNSGVVSLQNGTNTTVTNIGDGVWQVNATGGGGGITSLIQGTGILIDNPGGPTPTINNSGILNVVSATPGTLDVAVSNGIATLSVNGGSGVTKLIAGSNVSLSPTSGVGEVTISATGGGGGGSITRITSAAGSGIHVTSEEGPIVSLENTGVLEVTGGTGIRVDPNGQGKFIITNTQAASPVLSVTGQGNGISVSPTTGAVVVRNTGVTSVQGTANRIVVSGGTTGALTLDVGSSVVTSITAGNSGITVGGSSNAPSISATVANVTGGDGIEVSNASGTFTVKNTGVLALTEGTNVTITETSVGSGNFIISSTGGGGGADGTVKSITAGYGLSGGTITSTGTIAVKGDVVVTYDAYRAKGAGNILYSDSTGYDWTNNCSAGSPIAPMYLQGYQVGPATYVRWLPPEVGGFQDSPSITFHKAIIPEIDRNEYYFEINSNFQQEHCLNWSTNLPTIRSGQIPYGYPNVVAGQTNSTHYLNPPSTLNPSTTTWFLSGQFNQPPLLTDLYWQPKWNNLSDYAVTDVNVTAPILNTGTSKLPNISFDVNTTALTKYVPNSSFTLAGQLLYGTGPGTFSALNVGNNGQILSVNNSGQLTWIDPPDPTPPPAINLTPSDDGSITMDPNPILGEGTIGVTPGKFIESSVLGPAGIVYGAATTGLPSRLTLTPGGMIYGANSSGIPTVLSAPTNASSWLVSNGNAPSWKQFYASTGAKSTSIGSSAHFNSTDGNTCIGYNSVPTATNGGSPTSQVNQIVLASGTGNKMYILDTGALAFPLNPDGTGQVWSGSSGQFLTSQGANNPPRWTTPASTTGSAYTDDDYGATYSMPLFNLSGGFVTVQLWCRKINYSTGATINTSAWSISYSKNKGGAWVQTGLQDLLTGAPQPNLDTILLDMRPYISGSNSVLLYISLTGQPGYRVWATWSITYFPSDSRFQ